MTTTPNKPSSFKDLPVLGVGFGLRRPLAKQTLKANNLIDWLEFTPENYIDRGGKFKALLENAASLYPMISHGVSMSIGSVDPLNEDFLKKLEEIFKQTNPHWFSDHLCFSSFNGHYFNDLIPLPRTPETVQHVADRIKKLQDRFQKVFLIENASQYFNYPEDTMSDLDLFTKILETADCGMLLDVNNVYVNYKNHGADAFGGDPETYIKNLPLERVVQIHVAGHAETKKGLIDTHGAPVIDPVWALLRFTLAQNNCNPCGVMLERDNHLHSLDELVPEIEQIRTICNDADKCKPLEEPVQQAVAHA